MSFQPPVTGPGGGQPISDLLDAIYRRLVDDGYISGVDELGVHASDTSDVHGIADTTVLATDAELTVAVNALTASIALKQNASTAATDAELASAVAALNTAIAAKQDSATAATDSELAAAVASLTSALGLKQDASTAATDAELSAAIAAEATARGTALALKQDAGTAATDSELAAETTARQAADATLTASVISRLVLARLPDLLIVGAVTRDANGAVTSGAVKWPDGTAGTFAATAISTSFPGAVNAYTITHGSETYTQSAVTRDANGAVTSRPEITGP